MFGADLDTRVLFGAGVGRKSYNENVEIKSDYNIFTNWHHFGLPVPEIIIADILQQKYKRRFDAIICDPPYGIRVKSKKDYTP